MSPWPSVPGYPGGNALDFDGSDDYAVVPHSASLMPASAITVAAWVYLDSWAYYPVILSKGDVGQSWPYVLYGGNGEVFFDINSSAGSVSAVMVTGGWTHVAGVYDGTNISVYVNGVLGNSTDYRGGIPFGTSDVKIGCFGIDPRYPPDLLFDGRMDDIRIYRTALSAGAISNLLENAADADHDGLSNAEEFRHGTSPRNPDTDGDDMPDGWEVAHGFNPLDPADAAQDADSDGLGNLEEYRHGTHPRNPDTDGDDMPDGWEVANGFNPLDPADGAQDADSDGLSNAQEYVLGTDLFNPDSDDDGFTDGQEVLAGTDPLDLNRYPTVRYVSLTGAHVPPFISWATAATNLQSAIDAAAVGDTVRVTNGVYLNGGAVTPGASLMNRIVVTNAIIVESVNGPQVTIILGQGPLGDDAVRCAYVANGAILSGFTLSNGFTRASWDTAKNCAGGGAYLDEAFVVNCTITGNSALEGGGTYGRQVSDSVVLGNAAVIGPNFFGGEYSYSYTWPDPGGIGNTAIDISQLWWTYATVSLTYPTLLTYPGGGGPFHFSINMPPFPAVVLSMLGHELVTASWADAATVNFDPSNVTASGPTTVNGWVSVAYAGTGVVWYTFGTSDKVWMPSITVQDTTLPPVPKVDLEIYDGQNGEMVWEGVEESLGAFTVANLNDTDADLIPDNTDNDVRATGNGRNEVDLMRLVLRKPVPDLGGQVTLRIVSGHAKLWYFSEKILPVTVMQIDTSNLDLELWVETTAASDELRDIVLEMEYMGGKDSVKATGIWAEEVAMAHDTTDAATLFAEPQWDGTTTPPKDRINFWGGVGLRPVTLTGPPPANVILFKWRVRPDGVGDEPGIYLDQARQSEGRIWTVDDGTATPRGARSFPTGAEKDEGSNDDPLDELDESVKPNADNQYYSEDAPSLPSATSFITDPATPDLNVYRANFREYLRLGIGTDITGDGLKGSRMSPLWEWHVRHRFQNNNGVWQRTTGDATESDENDIGPGIITVGTEP